MRTSFYVTDEEYELTKAFIRKNCPTARFEENPLKVVNNWNLVLTMSVEDNNKLSAWMEKRKQSNQPKDTAKNNGFFNKIIRFFAFYAKKFGFIR